MKLMATATTISVLSVARVWVLLLQLLSVLQRPLQTTGNVLSKKVVSDCDEGCHCFRSDEGNCPSYPTITESMLPTYLALNHANPMDTECDPFQSSACVPTLEQGEACVVDLIAPNATTESSCPSGYSYRLSTVSSLENSIAGGQFITHMGACGTCSSLQDLALMIEYPNLPYQAQKCFFRSSAMKFVNEAITCYVEIGFTPSCSTTLAYHQKNILDKGCGFECAAWSYDGDLGSRSCIDENGCGACVDELGISARLELVAGRTFANSGYPSKNGQQCSDIAPVDVIGGSDICSEAPLEQSPAQVPLVSTPPTIAPVVPKTASPTTKLTQLPTVAPLPLATAVPTGIPTASPVVPTTSPTDVVTTAPVEPTANPVSIITSLPTPAPFPLPASSLSYQQCLSTAAIEVRVGRLSEGNGVFCDCSEAETGETNRPRCFSSPDRNDSSQCAILYDVCGSDESCCGSGVRSCRGDLCRPSGRKDGRNSLRLSGLLGGAARNDRNRRSASRFSNANDDGERRHRGRVRGRA